MRKRMPESACHNMACGLATDGNGNVSSVEPSGTRATKGDRNHAGMAIGPLGYGHDGTSGNSAAAATTAPAAHHARPVRRVHARWHASRISATSRATNSQTYTVY